LLSSYNNHFELCLSLSLFFFEQYLCLNSRSTVLPLEPLPSTLSGSVIFQIILCFLPRPASDSEIFLPFASSVFKRITGMNHHAWIVLWDRVLLMFLRMVVPNPDSYLQLPGEWSNRHKPQCPTLLWTLYLIVLVFNFIFLIFTLLLLDFFISGIYYYIFIMKEKDFNLIITTKSHILDTFSI
jgi:hypothetical protein